MNYIVFVLSVYLLLEFSQSFRDDEWQLELVQVLIRNGVSAPEELYPNDPNHPDVWEEGLGQLTLVGQKQLYALGKDLRKRYGHFLSSNPHELTVRSTYLEKCMSSALCVLASLYEPDVYWEFMPGLKWQPIPVNYEPSNKDKILYPIADFESLNPENFSGVKIDLDNYKELLKYWTLFSGMPVNDLFQISKLRNILFSEHINNHTIPHWAWKYWKNFEILNDFLYEFTFTESSVISKVGGPLLVKMVKNVIDKSEEKLKNKKIFIYSGQSAHVAGVLGALKVFNNKEPPFGAAFLMEMLKRRRENNDTGFDYGIRLRYFNETNYQFQIGEPKTLILSGCAEICPLQVFKNHTLQWEKLIGIRYRDL